MGPGRMQLLVELNRNIRCKPSVIFHERDVGLQAFSARQFKYPFQQERCDSLSRYALGGHLGLGRGDVGIHYI